MRLNSDFLTSSVRPAHRDLNDDQIIGAVDIQVFRIVDKIGVGVFGDDVEAVLSGNGNGLNQSAMNSVRYLAFLRFRLACNQRNSNQWHVISCE